MAQTITVNGVSVGGFVPRDQVEWSDSAYLGEVGSGKLVIDDSAGTVVTTGHKTVTVVQDAGSPTRLYTGYVGRRKVTRGEHAVGNARFIEVELADLNELLNRYVISDTDGKRSSETITARVSWLLGSDYLTSLVSNYGSVSSSSLTMDKTDYRGQRPGDVLAACAKRANFNYYVRWHAGSAAPELVFRDDNAGTADTSTVSIAAGTTANGTSVFVPIRDSVTLDVDPEHVYSGAYSTYSKGAVYRTRAATASAFVARDGNTDDSGIKTEDQARDEADLFLWESHTEEHTLALTLRMRAAYVNLIRAGQRVSVTIPELTTEGYGTATYMRVLRRRVSQPLNTDNDYDVALDLSPQEEAQPAPACAADATPSDTYYPLGGNNTTSIANPSDGVVFYWRAGYEYPWADDAGLVGAWHFPAYGAGGVGTIDYAGDCSQNRLIFVLIGNGTCVFQTEIYAGSTRAMEVRQNGVLVDSGTSGESFTVEIDDRTEDDCVTVIEVRDVGVCGGKWGFSQMEWTAA